MAQSIGFTPANIDVSVVMPTFHRELEVVEAVESALAQEAVSVEVIVIDDSPEGSAEANIRRIDDLRVRYIQCETPSGGHPATVRNEGSRLAQGRFVHFLDDDDHLLPGALRAMVEALDAKRSVGVAIGRVVPFGQDPQAVEENRAWAAGAARCAARTSGRRLFAAASLLFLDTMVVTSSCLTRRELVYRTGGYDPTMGIIEDVEFFARAIRRSGQVFVDHPVLHRRTGEPARTSSRDWASGYRTMHQKYRAEHGELEFLAMKVLARTVLRVMC